MWPSASKKAVRKLKQGEKKPPHEVQKKFGRQPWERKGKEGMIAGGRKSIERLKRLKRPVWKHERQIGRRGANDGTKEGK